MGQRKIKIKHIIFGGIIFVISMLTFLFSYDFPKKIILEFPAVEYREGEPLSAELTTIIVNGNLTRPIYGKSAFEGQFIIDKYEFTKTYDLIGTFLFDDISFANNVGYLNYFGVVKGEPIIEQFGTIWLSDDFDQLTILVNEPVGEEQKNAGYLRISAPAENYDEAMLINEKIENENK